MSNTVIINNRKCSIFGQTGPCFLYGYMDREENDMSPERLYEKARSLVKGQEFILCAYESLDWDMDFSPWRAARAFGGGEFPGGGKDTLAFLKDDLMTYMTETYPEIRGFYTAGYSLCGLFSLWALHEMKELSGCVCASGSLWYPGWEEYAADTERIAADATIYLSLGKTEEKTRNSMMKKVGDATRRQKELLADRSCILEWNEGGHFADSDERVARGIAWITKVH